jgi:hypothetical protein
MKDFRIYRVHKSMVVVHILNEGKPTQVRAFDSFDEAYKHILNHEGLVNQWDLILAQID